MEAVELKYESLCDALERLQEALKAYEHSTLLDDKEHARLLLESLIKRFELVYELYWKYLQYIVTYTHGLHKKTGSPRQVFRRCLDLNLITQEEFALHTSLIEARNKTVHRYDEFGAHSVARECKTLYKTLSAIVDRLQPNNDF